MCNRESVWHQLGRKAMSIVLSTLLITGSINHKTVYAQSEADFEIPVLTIEKDPTGVKGEDQQFIVRVTDNNAVGSVKLFYRFKANNDYIEAKLSSMDDDEELFVATIDQEQITSDVIQYYLSAVDLAGNAVQRGYAFAPLSVNLQQSRGAVDGSASPVVKTSSSKKTLYTILGVLAAGAVIGLAASASGGADSGGSGGGAEGCGSAGCVLTITAPRPGQ